MVMEKPSPVSFPGNHLFFPFLTFANSLAAIRQGVFGGGKFSVPNLFSTHMPFRGTVNH